MFKGVILFLGPRYNFKSEVGGVVILFENLLTYCNQKGIKYEIIDTNMSNYSNKYVGLFTILVKFLLKLKRITHVSIHATANDMIYLAPTIVFISKISKKTTSVRKFAGSFHLVYNSTSYLNKRFIEYVLKNSDLVFFETKYLVNKFKKFNINTFWWPNTREKTNYKTNPAYNKKFVFISQVKKTKGIIEYIEVAKRCDSSYCFDIYGPILEKDVKALIEKSNEVSYKGILNTKDVSRTLSSYDFLILPTYHEGEGYPGIIIEAFSCGVPVITTDWNAIPEIVINGFNGFIIAPKDIINLEKCIKSIKDIDYYKLSEAAYMSFEDFNSEKVNKVFFNSHLLKIEL